MNNITFVNVGYIVLDDVSFILSAETNIKACPIKILQRLPGTPNKNKKERKKEEERSKE